jgi:hypothetical protein
MGGHVYVCGVCVFCSFFYLDLIIFFSFLLFLHTLDLSLLGYWQVGVPSIIHRLPPSRSSMLSLFNGKNLSTPTTYLFITSKSNFDLWSCLNALPPPPKEVEICCLQLMILFFNMCARLLLLLLHQPISPPTFCPQNLHQPPPHQEVFNVNFGAWFSLHTMLHWNVVMRVGHFSCGHFEYLKF